MNRLTPRKARSCTVVILAAGLVVAVAGALTNGMAVTLAGVVLEMGGLVFDIIFYRCPNCGKYLDRSYGDYCPHCGVEMERWMDGGSAGQDGTRSVPEPAAHIKERVKEKENSMQYDFTTILDRRGWDAMAVDGLGKGFAPRPPKEGFDVIPMWVADMNFPAAPAIPEALIRRASHPAYGYFQLPPSYFEAIRNWQRTRNGVEDLPDEAIGYENGVLGGVVSALHVMCPRGGPVLVHSPTYIGFTNVLKANGYEIIHSPLTPDEKGVWRMDFADMADRLRRHSIHTAIFCSPHNPCGRVWERWEIEEVMELFAQYDVQVISDEIWSDLLLEGRRHIPTQSVSEDAKYRTVALYAPSKTFNLAGLVGSYHIICDRRLRDLVVKESSLSHYNSVNVLSVHALIAAYNEGAEWVDELCGVLAGNVSYACDFIAENFPGVRVFRPEATYMLFLDCTDWCAAHGITIDELEKRGSDVGVAWQDGRMFHGPCHIRMNLALPLSRVKEAFSRLKQYVFI